MTCLVAGLALAACSVEPGVRATSAGVVDSVPGTDGSDTSAPPSADSLDWGTCTDDKAEDEALQCATLTVPLDYASPRGDTIDLALVRAPATGTRKGAVLFNFGGPGASGFEAIAVNGTYLQQALQLDQYDVVGFDPRGVDRSNGIHCVTDEYFDAHAYLDNTPDTPEEQRLLDEDTTAFEDGCREHYGDTLGYYSTENTARDMDAIRAGLGDAQLTYFGISYGTYLGAVYATLFPDRVRAMMLDSAFDPAGDTPEQVYLTQPAGFEHAFDNFTTWCQSDDTCAFHSEDVAARWDALSARMDQTSLAGSDGRQANEAVIDTATTAALYSEEDWPVLAQALAAAENGDPDGLFSLADGYLGRRPDGSFDTIFQSFSVINCASGFVDPPADDPQALLTRIHEEAPRFGADVTLDDLTGSADFCAALMKPQPLLPTSYDGGSPIVVIGGTNDPATPIRWAQEMTATMGSNARLLTYTGEGHGQLLTSTCVTAAETALLVDLTTPDAGATCDPDPVVDKPDWWDDLPTPDGVTATEPLPAVLAAIGLSDTQGYGETHTTDLSPSDAVAAYTAAFKKAGLLKVDDSDISIADTKRVVFVVNGTEPVMVIAFGPGAFESDLSSAKGSVPAGKTVVLVAYVVV